LLKYLTQIYLINYLYNIAAYTSYNTTGEYAGTRNATKKLKIT